MSPGRLIGVVGPSGVGKDSVIGRLCAACPELYRVRRTVTRPDGAGGEEIDRVGEAAFHRMAADGRFVLRWGAHGLCYGIPRDVLPILGSGRDAIANLSRSVLIEARAKVARLTVLSLTARPEILSERLTRRAREDGAGIVRRLGRDVALPLGLDVLSIDNSGPLDQTVRAALAGLYPDRGTR